MICSSTNWRTISVMAFCSSVLSAYCGVATAMELPGRGRRPAQDNRPMRRALAAAIAAILLPVAPAAADTTLTSGTLEVRVDVSPFAVEVRDRADGDVLRTLGGAAPAPDDPHARYGPLGYAFDLREPV